MTDFLIVYITVSSTEEADRIATALIDKRLAACANIIPAVQSVFRWEHSVERETEALMLVKTTKALFPALADTVNSLHSYDVPEIIATPIACGSEDYLSWISAETQTFSA